MDDAERIQHLECVVDDLIQQCAEREEENESLKKQVRWLAEELVKASYSFTAQDWMELARKRVKDGIH